MHLAERKKQLTNQEKLLADRKQRLLAKIKLLVTLQQQGKVEPKGTLQEMTGVEEAQAMDWIMNQWEQMQMQSPDAEKNIAPEETDEEKN